LTNYLRQNDDELVKRITESFIAYRDLVGGYMTYADNGQMNARAGGHGLLMPIHRRRGPGRAGAFLGRRGSHAATGICDGNRPDEPRAWPAGWR
jgi:hypothetical protein